MDGVVKQKQPIPPEFIPHQLDKLQPDERGKIVKMGSNAGVAVRKRRMNARTAMDMLLACGVHDEETKKKLVEMGMPADNQAHLMTQIFQRAGKSALMARLLFELTGDLDNKPAQQVNIFTGMSDEQLQSERQRIIDGGTVEDCIDVTPTID